jgi:hypothetical protein
MIHTPCSTVLPEKLTGPPIVEKLAAFYGTREFINAFTKARHLSLCQISTVNVSPYHSLKIRFNSTLPFTTMSSKWSLSRMFTHNTLYVPLLLPHVLHALPISFEQMTHDYHTTNRTSKNCVQFSRMYNMKLTLVVSEYFEMYASVILQTE